LKQYEISESAHNIICGYSIVIARAARRGDSLTEARQIYFIEIFVDSFTTSGLADSCSPKFAAFRVSKTAIA